MVIGFPCLAARQSEQMREIKRLFDPKGILNPGKKFPREESP